MASIPREPRKGESVLWRNASVSCLGGYVALILVLRYMDPDDRAKSFRLVIGRFDTRKGWERYIEGLEKLEPAATFTLASIGIPENLRVYYSNRAWTNHDMRRWFRSKVGRTITETEYRRRENSRNEKSRIRLPVEFLKGNPGKWVVAKDSRRWGRPRKDGA